MKNHSAFVAEACPLPEPEIIMGLRVQEGTGDVREDQNSLRSGGNPIKKLSLKKTKLVLNSLKVYTTSI